MTNKVKIRKLLVNGFRGAKKTICLDCEDDIKNVVLFGNNGDGKTTFSDAIEWFYTDRINYLQREGCGREDYFNRYIGLNDDGKVELHFSSVSLNSEKTLKRKGGSSFSNTNSDFAGYIRDSSKDSLILRHHTMREFIDKTKTQKLESLEEIIGFGVVREIRDVLLGVANSLKDDTALAGLRGQRDERKRDIVEVIGKDRFGDNDILDYARKLAKECDSNLSITSMSDFEHTVKLLEQRIATSTKGKELLMLEGVSKNISSLIVLRDVFQEIGHFVLNHNELAKEQETIEASAIEKLYKAAIEAMENELVKPGECPLCKKAIDTDALLESLKRDIGEIQQVLKKRKAIIVKAKSLCTKLESSKANLESLVKLENKFRKACFTAVLDKITKIMPTLLSKHEEVLNNIEQSPQPVSLPSLSELDRIGEEVEKSHQIIGKRKESVAETEEERKFYQNANRLKTVLDANRRYKELTKHIHIFQEQIDSLGKIYTSFEQMEREGIQKVLKALSYDVNEFFVFLHPDDNIDEVELIPTEERGIEFKLKRHGEEISPPLKILSEAHLNSLGICSFLSSAKYFNSTNNFLVLDDVVTSFDAGHRRPLARLLDEKFPDSQFFLFTHDELWFDMLKTDLAPNKWVFKELVKWTMDNGVDMRESPRHLKERITNDLNENDVPGAANKCRTLIEEIFKQKCEDLGVRGLEFRTGKRNDKREASELISALLSYLKDNQTLREKESKKSFDHLRASQLITNIGSHHQKLTSTALHRGDIELVLTDIGAVESLFLCDICKTEPKKEYSPQYSKLKNCKCGEFKL